MRRGSEVLILYLSKLFKSKEDIPLVNINWREHFSSVSYVRHVSVIKSHPTFKKETEYGNVEVSYYLNECNYAVEADYLQGDVFIICELNELYKPTDNQSVRTMYYLVQINKDSLKGFEILNTTSNQRNYPWHENILISTILKDQKSFPSIQILNNYSEE